jgi:glutamate-1-semialdehyde 2,1-aminomutase
VQSTLLDERGVIRRFEAKTQNSARLFREAMRVTPGGVNAGIKFFEPYPIFMRRARGSHVWDVDGNEYVDYLMSYGALILGHGSEIVVRAAESVFTSVGTTVMGTPTEMEIEYGKTLRDLYHKDGLLRFTNSGLEATSLALRLSRAYTGKRKVAKFEGHYHGAVDHLLFSYSPSTGSAGKAESPVPIADSAEVDNRFLSDSLVLPFNDWEATHKLIVSHAKELACVIMEPFEEGVIAGDPRFMGNLRKLTRDLGIPLIYDEVKTGFRVRLGGAGEFYSITPDLTCLGKIIGGGLPIGALVGDLEIMGLLDPRKERKRRVFHSGTFNGNPLSLSVGNATVEELRRKGRFDTLRMRTTRLKQALSRSLSQRQIPHTVAGEGGMFNIYMTSKPVRNHRDVQNSDMRLRRFLDIELISRGVYLKPENRYCLSLAHTEDDVETTKERFAESLDAEMPRSN